MPYRRYNPLQDKWVLVSPHRFNRPWSGQTENTQETAMPEYDPACYLCPGNIRSGGAKNPQYNGTYTFINDFSALTAQREEHNQNDELLRQEGETGRCEVLCYSPLHNKTMSALSAKEIEAVIEMWQNRFVEIGKDPKINHIQIFENRGNEVGNSNPHPHGQLWAQEHVPTLPALEIRQQENYFRQHHSRLLQDYLTKELAAKERIVFQNERFALLVPFWAEWPYETMILPKFDLAGLDELKPDNLSSLAQILAVAAKAYAQLFQRPLYGSPYTMGLHQKPTDGKKCEAQLHFHFQPPMLTPTRQKFMVGYERFAEAQRDLTAEQAVSDLRKIIKNL